MGNNKSCSINNCSLNIHPRDKGPESREGTKVKEKDLQSELLANIHDLYFTPHTEKVLAPPVTQRRRKL